MADEIDTATAPELSRKQRTVWCERRPGLAAQGVGLALLVALLAIMYANGVRLWFFEVWALVMAAALVVAAVRRRRLTFGADGVFSRTMSDERWIPWSEIAHIEKRLTHSIEVTLTDGTVLRAVASRDPGREALLAYIRVAMAKHAAAPRPSPPSLLVRDAKARGSDWVSSLHVLATDSSFGGFRDGAATKERLWAIVESPASEPADRAAAAVALGGTRLDEQGRKRLRDHADNTSVPKLRVVLEHTADGKGDVEDALLGLERARMRRMTRRV